MWTDRSFAGQDHPDRTMAPTEKAHERTASTDQRTSWSWRKLFGDKFGKEDCNNIPPAPPPEETSRPGIARRLSRKVVPGLPRPGTFKRQQSELRDRLEPIKPNTDERRTASVDRRRNISCRDSATAVAAAPRLSAPELLDTTETIDAVLDRSKASTTTTQRDEVREYVEVSKEPSIADTQSVSTEAFDEMILEELERRWILNLSMHFRDKSKREKFFVTFAETPTHWRRVTISLDYRNAPKGSLEEELLKTRFQRDKSARIYEAIRESLPDIQFYDTVTNLKLQTENERLHVHVVEDTSEIISYPPVRAINHLKCRRIREDELVFDSHLSGFVYKVRVDGQVFIKKEIPGPDTVDEFLYEINALHQLSGSHSVIQFGGVVLDNKGEHVKGLLISFAEQGALIDVIYDGEGNIPWKRRERWAKQIVQGLSEIHEAGFVQGDFTLSNIVIDDYDNAKIIDINRRGCPVGWEPPEVAALIESSQRISMYIGVKSDLYQLGMVLYALATQQDEPENHRPLNLASFPPEIPDYYLDLCEHCLNEDPRMRSQASALLTLFPPIEENYHQEEVRIPVIMETRHPDEVPYSNGIYLDPAMNSNYSQAKTLDSSIDVHDYAATDASEYDYPRRGRSPPAPQRYKMDPRNIPLPASSSGSDYPDNSTWDTPAEIPLPISSSGSGYLDSSTHDSPAHNPTEPASNLVSEHYLDSSTHDPAATNNPMAPVSKLAFKNEQYQDLLHSRCDSLDISPRHTPAVNGATQPVSNPLANLASKNEQYQDPNYTKPQEMGERPPTPPTEEQPRPTAAAYEAPTAYPDDLAGVGSAYGPYACQFEIPRKANLDDDLTTDMMHNDRIVL
jgi:serine/threonine protein kinase